MNTGFLSISEKVLIDLSALDVKVRIRPDLLKFRFQLESTNFKQYLVGKVPIAAVEGWLRFGLIVMILLNRRILALELKQYKFRCR